jgi:Tol biopolymer transport system component
MASNLVPNDTNGNWGIFVHDRDTGNTSHVSVSSDGEQANGFSFGPSISADGRYVAFVSGASNLVTNDTDRNWDIFVRDRDAGKTTRVSVSTDEQQANDFSFWPSISADGRYVAFYSVASNLVPNDTNGSEDVFITKNFLYGGIITPPPPPPPTGDNHSPTITFSNDSGFQTDYVNPNKGTTVTDFQWL